VADEDDAQEPSQDDRKARDGVSWWDLLDLVEIVVWIGRGIWALCALIASVFVD
jgi:hypothetical protein